MDQLEKPGLLDLLVRQDLLAREDLQDRLGLLVDEDLLEVLGLRDPKDLVESGVSLDLLEK